jgi:urea transport system ATP-binding protein
MMRKEEQEQSIDTLLVKNLKLSFSSAFSLDIPFFSIQNKSIEIVIGGNGAGKTTLCDAISGKTKADEGEIFLLGRDISGHSETEIAAAGVGRKFQTPSVFDSQTVWQNLELALPGRNKLMRNLFRNKPSKSEHALIEEILYEAHLQNQSSELAGFLSHGQRQWLALAMLKLADPKLLLIDEPAAGLTYLEVEKTSSFIKRLSRSHAVLVIEHNMDFVKTLDAPITFMDKGRILSRGSFVEITRDPYVYEAYWGGKSENDEKKGG